MLALLPLLVAVRAIKIHPGGSNQFCLEAQGAHANGIAVIINQCSDSMYQEWAISPGSTIVQLAGQNYCLDAGSAPANGVRMKIWQCYPNLPAQTWWQTDDGRIALQGQGMCLDLMDGIMWGNTPTQLWECGDSTPNQIWITSGEPMPTYTPGMPQCFPTTVTSTVYAAYTVTAGAPEERRR